VDDRAALSGIIFVLKSGIPWEMFCPKRWAAALELPAGDAWVSGNRQVYGSGCTRCFWIA
jgi:hypothetical protein